MEILTIKIINWDKHNPKRDQKSYTWLRLNNDICTDPELFGLDAEQKFCWIEILCQASRKNNGTLSINLSQISDVTKVSIVKISKLIEFLQLKPVIEVHDRTLPQTAVTTTPTNVRTRRTRRDETNVRDEHIAPTCKQIVADAPLPDELLAAHPFLIERKAKTALVREWLLIFPEPDWIISELKKAHLWEVANPRKKKKDFGKFMTNWLTRGWDTRKISSTNNRSEQRTQNNRVAAQEYMNKLNGDKK